MPKGISIVIIIIILVVLAGVVLFSQSTNVEQKPSAEEPKVTPEIPEVPAQLIEPPVKPIEEMEEPELTVEPEEDQRYTPPRNYGKTVTLDEPLVLSGDEVMTIEDTHYIFKNDIVLRDNSKLVVRNSFIDHQKNYSAQYSLDVYDNSKVILENVELRNECTGTLNWNFYDTSSFEANKVQQKGCNIWTYYSRSASASVNKWDWFGGTTCDNASLFAENSENLEIELCNAQGFDMDIELPVVIDEWEFSGETVLGTKNTIILKNVTIDGWGVGAFYGDEITIRNGHAVTVSFGVGLPYEGKTIILDDLDRKHYADRTWQMDDGYIRMVNTTIYGWETSAWAKDHTLIIRNSNFTGPTLNSDNSKVIIENSYMEIANAFENVELTIKDSTVSTDVIARDDSIIKLVNTKVDGRIIEEGNGQVYVDGVSYQQ